MEVGHQGFHNISQASVHHIREIVPAVNPMRWSVTRFCGKLYVRIFSLRSPDPTWLRRFSAIDFCCSCSAMSYSLERSTRMAFARFLIWDFSSWQETTNPVGMWVMRTAE